jgi:ecotropic viral integration site 5 protein
VCIFFKLGLTLTVGSRFPLEIVFRIYDNCLANGIEAIFGYSVMLLKKNEDALLGLKFDEILAFMNKKLLDCYTVRFLMPVEV